MDLPSKPKNLKTSNNQIAHADAQQKVDTDNHKEETSETSETSESSETSEDTTNEEQKNKAKKEKKFKEGKADSKETKGKPKSKNDVKHEIKEENSEEPLEPTGTESTTKKKNVPKTEEFTQKEDEQKPDRWYQRLNVFNKKTGKKEEIADTSDEKQNVNPKPKSKAKEVESKTSEKLDTEKLETENKPQKTDKDSENEHGKKEDTTDPKRDIKKKLQDLTPAGSGFLQRYLKSDPFYLELPSTKLKLERGRLQNLSLPIDQPTSLANPYKQPIRDDIPNYESYFMKTMEVLHATDRRRALNIAVKDIDSAFAMLNVADDLDAGDQRNYCKRFIMEHVTEENFMELEKRSITKWDDIARYCHSYQNSQGSTRDVAALTKMIKNVLKNKDKDAKATIETEIQQNEMQNFQLINVRVFKRSLEWLFAVLRETEDYPMDIHISWLFDQMIQSGHADLVVDTWNKEFPKKGANLRPLALTSIINAILVSPNAREKTLKSLQVPMNLLKTRWWPQTDKRAPESVSGAIPLLLNWLDSAPKGELGIVLQWAICQPLLMETEEAQKWISEKLTSLPEKQMKDILKWCRSIDAETANIIEAAIKQHKSTKAPADTKITDNKPTVEPKTSEATTVTDNRGEQQSD